MRLLRVAVAVAPGDWRGHAMLADALAGWGETVAPTDLPRALALYEEAAEKLAQAQQLDAEAANYNLACLAGVRGNLDEAFERLERALQAGQPTWDHLRDDERYKRLQQTFGS